MHDLSFRNCDKPRLIEALKTKRIRDIACGSSHSAAITSSGELYSWGLGEYGRLGHGDNTTQLRPKLVCLKMSILCRHSGQLKVKKGHGYENILRNDQLWEYSYFSEHIFSNLNNIQSLWKLFRLTYIFHYLLYCSHLLKSFKIIFS